VRFLRRVWAFFPSIERLLRRLSLRAQVAILLAIAMLPVGVFAVAQGAANYTVTKKLQREAVTLGAVEASQREQGEILEAFGQLSAIGSQLDLDGSDSACRTVLKAFIDNERSVPFIGYIPADGMMECSFPEVPTVDFSEEMNFRSLMESPRRSVTAEEKGRVSGLQVIVIRQPVYRAGIQSGVLSMSLPSKYLEWVTRTKDLPPEARFAIVTANGVGVAQSKPATDFEWLPAASTLRTILSQDDRVQELNSREGLRRVYAIAPLFQQDIFAISSWPNDRVPAALGWRNLLTISLPMLMWALAVAVAYFAVDQLALRHIVYLDRLVGAYGRSGRALRARRVREAPTELAQLGASFDTMAREIETREHTLMETVEEKETLLREVNHRVKNNLQLITSLMSLQIRDAGGERERAGLERLQDRIQGLALVHQKIYESENTNAVRLDLMIGEIARNLLEGSARSRTSVTLTIELDPVTATPDSAVPFVLFATEAIVNTFKHSLSHVDRGRLNIQLKDSEEALTLRVANSLGSQPPPSQQSGRKGIGQQLIDGFARQLRGRIERSETDDEYRIALVVPKVDLGTTRSTVN